MLNRLPLFLVLSLLMNAAFVTDLIGDLYRRSESLDVVPGRTMSIFVDDQSIVKRIVNSYQLAIVEQEDLGNSMWKVIFNQYHAKIHPIFKDGDLVAAGAILRDPGSSDLFWGIDNLAVSLLTPLTTDYPAHCLDILVRFAEAIGAVRIENPEGYAYFPLVRWDADTIIQSIQKALEAPIYFPNPYPNEYGASSSYGVISDRATHALYQAWRIKQLLKGVQHPRVLEIGAGVGRTAFYARLLGIEDYTIVDLPMTSLASGYFLSRTLGEDQVQLYGERMEGSAKRIKFISPAKFISGEEHYDLIINVDSMTEMDLCTGQKIISCSTSH